MSIFLSKYKDYNVYKLKNNDIIYFYISNKHHDYNNISYSKSIISYIQFVYNEDSSTVIFLKTKKRYRNKGYASYLLKTSIKYFKEKKMKKIELDDMSNYAHDLENNIYIKHDFTYKNKYPEPEMILNLY